jgi:group II intron reverse transcriptase/maturase
MASTPQTVRQLQRKLYCASKQKEDYRFYSLYDKLYRADILHAAYHRCRANRGAPGVDGVSFQDIERQGREAFLEEIAEALRTHRYRVSPIRRVMIPKANGKERALGIATIRDRVVQTACKLVLEPIVEPHLSADSYGYRPERSAAMAVRAIETSLKAGYQQVYDADLSAYFDTIPQDRMMDKLARHVSDQNFLALIRQGLRAPVRIEQGTGASWESPTQGTAQGSPLSPLLANLYLNDFCHLIVQRTPCRIVVYADDFVILHRQHYTETQLDWLAHQLAVEGLTLNRDKTRVVDMTVCGAQVDFLGFSVRRVRGYYRGKEYIKIQPSKASMAHFKEQIRQIVRHRTSLTLAQLIARVNPIIRGWRNYFAAVGYPRAVFFKLDWFVCARFYRWSRRLSQRPGKRLAQNAWEVLRRVGLQYLQPIVGRTPVKGAR